MKKVLFTAVLSTLVLLFSCEVEQAITGVRTQNSASYDLTEVLIVPNGVSFDEGTDLLSSNIAVDDFREFETGVGTFDIRVEIGYEVYQYYYRVEISEEEVVKITVTDPVAA